MPSRVHNVRCPSTLLVGFLVLFTACGETGPSAPVDPSSVRAVSGAQLSGTAGQPLTDRVTVRVLDASNNPLEGVVVSFAVSAGGGTVTPASATTDDNGEAATRWTLGTTAGSNILTATVPGGASVQITATGTAGRPATVAATAGNNQSATAGTAVATNPAVVVRDANNNPVPGATVVFSAVAGGGQVTDPVRQTNAQGIATVGQWRLGNNVGPQTLTAVVAEAGVSAVFTATATAGAPASIVAVSPTTQSAGAGSLVANPPSVRVNDANGNPVANVQVTFAVTGGGGQLTGATQTTNAQGIATVTSWILGGTIGLNTVSATVAGVPSITFSATATAGAPAVLAITEGDGQLVPINRPAPIAPQVIVRDANGNPVSGVNVTFTVASGGGLVISGNQTTNSSGLATVGAWFMGGTPGPNTLVVSSPGLVSVTFNATATAGPPVSMQAVSLVSQGGTAGANVASPPSVVVRDALGNPASGVEVTFTVTGGGGTVVDPIQTTGFDGVATATAWTLGVTPGINTVVASSPGLPSVTFTASSVGPAAAVVAFAGNAQAAVQGTPVPVRPAVRVLDAAGNGVPGTSVVFAVTGGGGSVTGGSQITDVNGIATVGNWTLGSTVGQTMTATVGVGGVAGNPVTFTASAATQIVVTSAPASAPLGSNFSITVELRDANNILSQASGVPLTIAIQAGGGTLNGTATVNTNATGMVTFTINVTGAAGNRTFRISGAGLSQAITGNVNIS
ncbi:MAG: beta strand repeat-containing protein [Gemmatimonadaceae bacterium]